MRAFLLFILVIGMASCGSDHKPQSEITTAKADTMLRLPVLAGGMRVDSTLPAMQISAVTGDTMSAALAFTGDTASDVICIYADSALASAVVDSCVNRYCQGKDVRLMGLLNGEKVGLPFHSLHRFNPYLDSLRVYEWDYHLLFIDSQELSVNSWTESLDAETYFRHFYGNAFAPHDSVIRFPQRKPNQQTITALMLEGQAWDETDIKHASDTAAMLAAYNEFVNKLEIFDKAGAFHTFRVAAITAEALPSVTWSRTMQVFSLHYKVQQELRSSAKEYLAAKLANDGATAQKEFTEEDLRLLYPDRLVWNGRVSGVYEHRYDPMLLAPWYWVEPPPVVKPPPPRDSPDV